MQHATAITLDIITHWLVGLGVEQLIRRFEDVEINVEVGRQREVRIMGLCELCSIHPLWYCLGLA